MEYLGLEAGDLEDVRALNDAFLDLLRGADGVALRNKLPAPLRRAVAALSQRQIDRLATVPFLLLSCAAYAEDYWTATPPPHPVRDLFTPATGVADPATQLTGATLGYLWQLTRKNAYSARLVSGAAIEWCEQLAACSLLAVLQRAAENARALSPRLADDKIFWHRLLGAGLSSSPEIRRAAHLSTLQTVLSKQARSQPPRFRTAACYSSVPAVRRSERTNK